MTETQVSVVVPVHNEAESVAPLAEEIEAVMEGLGLTWELVFVDDGSTDATWERLRDLHAERGLRALRLARNFGKSSALAAGFAAARSSVIITLDGDLQDDPHEIPHLLAALEDGLDLACGWRRSRCDLWSKCVASGLFNRVVSGLTGLGLHDINCGFKAYRAECARRLPLRRGMHRFVPLLAKARGCRVGEIAVAHRPRRHGRSKYGWGRALEAYVDLHLAWLLGRDPPRRPMVLGAIGAALLALGTGLIAGATRAQTTPWGLVAVGGALDLGGAHLVVMALLTGRALAREPEGAQYSIAERLD